MKTAAIAIILASIIHLLLFSSCTWKTELEQVKEKNPALLDLLKEFKKDKEKHEALKYLLVHADSSKIKVYNKDSVRFNIDHVCNSWRSTPWHTDYKKDVFYEYVLPMQIASEPLEYYWRTDILKHLHISSPIKDVEELSEEINRQVIINTSRDSWGAPLLGYTKTIQGNYGRCDDRAILLAMAMRAYNIPSAYEIIPRWGSSNNGHSVCSLIKPDGSTEVFQSPHDEGNVFLLHKTPKVYRYAFSPQTETAVYKYRKTETLPDLFTDFRLKDVTSFHSIGFQDVTLEVDTTLESKIVYLSVFSTDNWFPIAYAARKGKQVEFKDVGNGTNKHGKNSTLGDDIGFGILYLPCYHIEDEIVPCCDPIIISPEGIRKITCNPQVKEKLTLYRKYPRFQRIKKFADEMVDGVIEGAKRADYSDAETIHYIFQTPLSGLQKVPVDGKYRYIRYRKPQGIFSIGELGVFDPSGTKLTCTLHVDKTLKYEPEIKNVIDGDPLTYYSLTGGVDVWAGVDLGTVKNIGAVEFAPRNDDNSISVGDDYELFYWKGEWISLGRKKAMEDKLEYDHVPKGALLWLRNLTKGREERPFTYENGRQIWW